jgi:hypothetical protein
MCAAGGKRPDRLRVDPHARGSGYEIRDDDRVVAGVEVIDGGRLSFMTVASR